MHYYLIDHKSTPKNEFTLNHKKIIGKDLPENLLTEGDEKSESSDKSAKSKTSKYSFKGMNF